MALANAGETVQGIDLKSCAARAATTAVTAAIGGAALSSAGRGGLRGGSGVRKSGGGATNETGLPVPFDGEFATKQLLGVTKTPRGRTINFHAASRMINPPRGRSSMTPAQVDTVLDGATNIRKRTFHPNGNTLTIQNRNLPGKPQVIVDERTGRTIITVINPR